MRIVNCYYCGSNENRFYIAENGFTLVKCNGCGLLFVKDQPEVNEISEASKQGKHEGVKEIDVTRDFRNWKIPRYLRILNDLFDDNIESNKSWLDVGCGHGEFMKAVQQFSDGKIKIRGTEPNSIKQESARSRGLDVGYFDLKSHNEKYDIVSLLNVYSHLPDPPNFLKSLKGLINTNGEIILETGDTTHLKAKEFVRPLDLPDHLSFASQDIVVNILESIGFEIVCIKKYPLLESNIKSYVRELAKIFLPNYESRIQYINRKRYSNIDMYIRARLVE